MEQLYCSFLQFYSTDELQNKKKKKNRLAAPLVADLYLIII